MACCIRGPCVQHTTVRKASLTNQMDHAVTEERFTVFKDWAKQTIDRLYRLHVFRFGAGRARSCPLGSVRRVIHAEDLLR